MPAVMGGQNVLLLLVKDHPNDLGVRLMTKLLSQHMLNKLNNEDRKSFGYLIEMSSEIEN